MTKVQALIQLLQDNGGIANWNIIYNSIENYYPDAKRPKQWKAGLRGVLYRDLDKNFKMIDKGVIALIDYDENQIDFVKEEICDDNGTTKEVTITARKGQEKFRKSLLEEFKACPITKIDDKRLLIASHIKPWVFSNDYERLDNLNGFILSPMYDRLFDNGLITFDFNAKIIFSKKLTTKNIKLLNIDCKKTYKDLKVCERQKYLEFHQNNIFLG